MCQRAASNSRSRSHIKKAFLKVFAQIDILIDAQVRKAKDKGHRLTVSILPNHYPVLNKL